MRWTRPDALTTDHVLPPLPHRGERRGEGGSVSSSPSPTGPSADLPPHLDHADLLDHYLNPDIPPRELAEIFNLSLAQLAAWVASPRTRADIEAINRVTHQRAADLAPAQHATATHTLAAIAATSPGANLSPLECRANETARRAATRLLASLSHTQPRAQPARPSRAPAAAPPPAPDTHNNLQPDTLAAAHRPPPQSHAGRHAPPANARPKPRPAPPVAGPDHPTDAMTPDANTVGATDPVDALLFLEEPRRPHPPPGAGLAPAGTPFLRTCAPGMRPGSDPAASARGGGESGEAPRAYKEMAGRGLQAAPHRERASGPYLRETRERTPMRTIALLTPAVAASTLLAGGITYNEAVDGDLSDDRFAPTSLALTEGINTITLDVVISDQPGGDRDYFTFNVGAGLFIDSVILIDASNPNGGIDSTAFVGFTSGNFFDFDPDTFQGSLNGFTLTADELIGTDLLPALNAQSGSPVPSPAGDYTFWVQQTGTDLTQVTLDIVITPAPGSASAMALAGLLGARRRRRA